MFEQLDNQDREGVLCTLFQSKTDNQGQRITVSPETFAQAAREPYGADLPKDMAALWAPATFAADTRRDSGVEAVHLLVLDIDNQCEHHVLPEHVREVLEGEDITHVIHATRSSTQSHPKFRLVVWIDRPIEDMTEHRRALVGLFDLLGRPSGVDLSCWNPGRIYYMPHAGQHYFQHAYDGEPLSVDTLCWQIADDDPLLHKLPTTGRALPYQGMPQATGRNNALKAQAYAGLCKRKPIAQVVAEVLDYDRKHHSPPLFEDPSEPYLKKGGTPEAAAEALVSSVARTIEHRASMGMVRFESPENASPGLSEGLDITISNDGDFRQDLTIPEYVVDGMFAKSYLYAVTGHAGTGKTAMALTLAYAVARGDTFMERMTLRNTVNTHCHRHNHDYGLVIVDTDVAYYGGSDENDNVERRYHAQCLRRLIDITGRPAVVTLCHPSKGATAETMEPRGGGAFLGEIDCAITMLGSRECVQMEPHPEASIRARVLDLEAGMMGTVMKVSTATISRDIQQLKEMEYIKRAVRGFELTRRGKAAVESGE